jgi:hypothetical protein
VDKLLVSMALGDGYITPPNKSQKSVLWIRHSTHQKDYLEWKHNQIKSVCAIKPTPYINRIKDKVYNGVYIRTVPLQELAVIRSQLYPKKIKQYSLDILSKLDSLGLAIWYMDDGCVDRPINKNAMGILNTYASSPNGQEEIVIQKYFKEQWNIDCALNKGHGRYRIRFNNPNFVKFVELVKPHIIESLKYKIDTTMRYNALTRTEDNSVSKI